MQREYVKKWQNQAYTLWMYSWNYVQFCTLCKGFLLRIEMYVVFEKYCEGWDLTFGDNQIQMLIQLKLEKEHDAFDGELG